MMSGEHVAMLATHGRHALVRIFFVTCFAVGLLGGCGSSTNGPSPPSDAAADVPQDSAVDTTRSDGPGQDIGADSNGLADASGNDAPRDTSSADQGAVDVGADRGGDGGSSADASGETGTDATAPDAGSDVGGADVDAGGANDVAVDQDAGDAIADARNDVMAVEILTGGTYGAYVVQAIAINGAPPGTYTLSVAGPTAGSVTLNRTGSPVKTVSYNWQTTVSATNPEMFYTFDFATYLAITIRKAGTGTTNLYEMDQSIFNGADYLIVVPGMDGSTADGGTVPIASGGTYGDYVVEAIAMSGAPTGSYTFHVASPTAGMVELRRDGSPVTTVSYNWQTTVSATDSNLFYTFVFAGHFSLTIRKAGSGTINLYGMDQSIFDGAHVLSVVADGGGGD